MKLSCENMVSRSELTSPRANVQGWTKDRGEREWRTWAGALTTYLDGEEQCEPDGREVCCSERKSRPRKEVLRVLDWAH